MTSPLVAVARIMLLVACTHCASALGQPEAKPDAQRPAKPSRVSEQELQQLIQAEYAKLEERGKRIDAELAALDRAKLPDGDWAKEWAGTYYTGDGLGMNVSIKIAPKAGITYTWHGCLGLYDANHGDIVETFDGGVVVRLAIDTKASLYRFMSAKLYFVRWGERHFLVPESQMLELVNAYNEGGYAREGMYTIPKFEGEARHHFDSAPPGRPKLPPEYAKLIIEKPLRLTISKVTERPKREVTRGVDASECSLEIEGGSDQGVFVGMEIPFQLGVTFGKIKIDRVDAKTSSGALTVFYGPNEKVQLPTPGTVLSFPGAQPDEAPKPAEERKPK